MIQPPNNFDNSLSLSVFVTKARSPMQTTLSLSSSRKLSLNSKRSIERPRQLMARTSGDDPFVLG
jgi:hypothetical protein